MLDMVKISGFVDRRKGLGRPTKREGRQLEDFTSHIYDDFTLWMDEEEEDDLDLD